MTVIVSFLLPLVTAVDLKSCILEVRNGTYGLVGGTDNHGHPVSNISTATAITYDLCVHACGASAEPFIWTAFAQEVSAWLLPWMALVSQLPFGANDNLDNFASVLLTVGSPALAAYSLALTVLNERWIAQRFAAYSYPNIKSAVQILGSLQQAPLIVTKTNSLLASLVVLPDNDAWWSELAVWLDYTHTWSVSVVVSITWVIIAYVITLIDVFTHMTNRSSHTAIGCLWLWSLPIVIGWLQISPKCDATRLRRAIKRANEITYVATPSGKPVLAESLTNQQAISLALFTNDPIRSDVQCTAPIFNYSRFYSWAIAVEDVLSVFREASDRAHVHCSVNPDIDWETTVKSHGPSPRNRSGTREQVDAYCLPAREPSANRRSRRWAHGIWSRFLVASMVALSLQWGTTGGAIIIPWFTPTIGKYPGPHQRQPLANIHFRHFRAWVPIGCIYRIRHVVDYRLDPACPLQSPFPLLGNCTT